MALLEYIERGCPWCGEPCLLVIDCSTGDQQGRQQYVEDCQVCCRPMVVSIVLHDDNTPPEVELTAEGE